MLDVVIKDAVIVDGTGAEAYAGDIGISDGTIAELGKVTSPAHREILLLRFVESMPYEEIAQVLELNPGTVRSRIHYAKLALRKRMEEQTDDRK